MSESSLTNNSHIMCSERIGEKENGTSLAEIVVAAGVLAVLIALVVPGLTRLQSLGESTKCVSNLRQIGWGILAYTQDNNGRLPGPLYIGQYPYWNHYTQLSSHVADYLELDTTRRKLKKPEDVFLCPAFKRASGEMGSSPVFALNARVFMAGTEGPAPPFGYPNSLYPEIFGTHEDFLPRRLVSLADIVDEEGNPAAGSTWALRDLDRMDPEFNTHFAAYFHHAPPIPVHGTHRNALFYDFHVAPILVNEN